MKDFAAAREAYEKAYAQTPERAGANFRTLSGEGLQPLYSPADLQGLNYPKDLGQPGEFPYTRGIHATMYRGRHWTMRQFAGFGTAPETNRRFHYLLGHG